MATGLNKRESREIAYKKFIDEFGFYNPEILFGVKWLKSHFDKFTWQDFENQTLTLTIDNHTTTLKPTISAKDAKYIFKQKVVHGR
jgi:hypothetical protein